MFTVPDQDAFAQAHCSTSDVVATHISDINQIVDCTDGWRQTFSFPSGLHVMPYRRQVLSSPYGGYHLNVTKFDMVWIANTITIDAPLRSFGGDIVLFAETLNINAPIDSRVYIEHDVDNFEPGDSSKHTQKTDDAMYAGRPVGVNAHPAYKVAFREYYLKCYDCESNETRFPELPSGLAAASPQGIASSGKFNGQSAPDNLILFSEVRSGNITIFANRINISPALLKPEIPDYRAECNRESTAITKFAINAGGIAGGRGGAGSASSCIVHPPPANSDVQFDCGAQLYDMTGGLSGAGGQGGDAGNIQIELVANPNLTEIEAALKSVSNVAGGAPGANATFRTPAAEGPNAVQANRCSFKEEGYPYKPANAGADGAVTIAKGTSEDSLQQLARHLAANDSRLDYDYFIFLNMAKSDAAIHSTAFSSRLSDYLSTELVNSEVKVAGDLDSLIGLDKKEQGTPYLSPMLVGINNAKFDEQVFGEQQQSLLRELAKYDVGSEGVTAVLRNFGGMFHVATKNAATTRMSAQQLRVEVTQGTQTLSEIKEELRSINSLLFASLTWSQGQELQARINKLSDEVKQLEDELAKQSESQPGLLSILPAVRDFGTAISEMLSGVSSGNFSSAAEALTKASAAYNTLVAPKESQTLQQAIEETRKNLAEVTLEYEELLTYVSDQKQRYFSERFVDLQQSLRSRGSVVSQLTSESFLFPDLIKIALISYFDDVTSDKAQLRTNLKALQVYLRDFPNQEPYIKLSEINWNCDLASCQTYQASEGWREVQARIRLGSQIQLFPLYVLAPIARATPPMPTFLLDPSLITVKTTQRRPTANVQMFVTPTLQ